MADYEVTPVYNSTMHKIEGEPADAELFNTRLQVLLNNDVYLKQETEEKAAKTHVHTKNQIMDFPTSLPASGGTANTAVKLATTRKINGVAFDGSVDITIEDGTKLPITGGTVEGELRLEKGYFVHYVTSTGGKEEYFYVAQIAISKAYANAPIEIQIAQRGMTETSKLIIAYENSNTTDPKITKFHYQGKIIGAYLYKSGISLWDLYVRRTELYDALAVLSFHCSPYLEGLMSINWKTEHLRNLPTGAIEATFLPANGGNAATVNGFTVNSNIPAGAKFTDTVYTHPPTHLASVIAQDANNRFTTDTEKSTWNSKAAGTHTHTKANITDFPTSLPANGGNAATVNGKTVLANVPADAKFTDTLYAHPTTSGNKHVPAGGASGNVLGWSGDGNTIWKPIATASTSAPVSNLGEGNMHFQY